jgi:hypothetical protein
VTVGGIPKTAAPLVLVDPEAIVAVSLSGAEELGSRRCLDGRVGTQGAHELGQRAMALDTTETCGPAEQAEGVVPGSGPPVRSSILSQMRRWLSE